MAAFLTAESVAKIEWILKYLDGNVEKPIDENAVHVLSTMAVDMGSSQIAFKENMLNRPVSTLLGSILAANEIAAK